MPDTIREELTVRDYEGEPKSEQQIQAEQLFEERNITQGRISNLLGQLKVPFAKLKSVL